MTDEEQNNDKNGVVTAPAATAPHPLAIPGAIVIAGIFIALAIIFSGSGSGTPAPQADNNNGGNGQLSNEERLELAAMQKDDHVRGNRDADVYILEFSDTECPFCKRFHTTMQQVMEEYDGEVAWVYRHFPLAQLHPTAPREAEALECANELGGEDAFWAYTDAVYEQTPDSAPLPDEQLGTIAGEVGLDVATFTTCLNSGKYTAEVQKDFDNAVALGGRGTPHSLIVAGDTIIPINGAQPFSVVKASLDSVLR